MISSYRNSGKINFLLDSAEKKPPCVKMTLNTVDKE